MRKLTSVNMEIYTYIDQSFQGNNSNTIFPELWRNEINFYTFNLQLFLSFWQEIDIFNLYRPLSEPAIQLQPAGCAHALFIPDSVKHTRVGRAHIDFRSFEQF
jgi:hypothetical protein